MNPDDPTRRRWPLHVGDRVLYLSRILGPGEDRARVSDYARPPFYDSVGDLYLPTPGVHVYSNGTLCSNHVLPVVVRLYHHETAPTTTAAALHFLADCIEIERWEARFRNR